jgi:hypothetical protein
MYASRMCPEGMRASVLCPEVLQRALPQSSLLPSEDVLPEGM